MHGTIGVARNNGSRYLFSVARVTVCTAKTHYMKNGALSFVAVTAGSLEMVLY